MPFVGEPIIFPDKDSVGCVLEDKVPRVAEDNTFKVCNFCGPFRTHAEGCKAAIEMFEKLHPEFRKPESTNAWLSKFRCGAIFSCAERKSVVVFLSTTSEGEVNRIWKPMAGVLE